MEQIKHSQNIIIRAVLSVILGMVSLIGVLILAEYLWNAIDRSSFQRDLIGVIFDVVAIILSGYTYWYLIKGQKTASKNPIKVIITLLIGWSIWLTVTKLLMR